MQKREKTPNGQNVKKRKFHALVSSLFDRVTKLLLLFLTFTSFFLFFAFYFVQFFNCFYRQFFIDVMRCYSFLFNEFRVCFVLNLKSYVKFFNFFYLHEFLFEYIYVLEFQNVNNSLFKIFTLIFFRFLLFSNTTH